MSLPGLSSVGSESCGVSLDLGHAQMVEWRCGREAGVAIGSSLVMSCGDEAG